MAWSSREKTIGILSAAVILLLVIDRVALEPLLGRRAELQSEVEQLSERLAKADRLFNQRRKASARWAQMGGGNLRQDVSEAEGLLLNSTRDWAQDAGLSLQSLRPDRVELKGGFQLISIRATATGGMGSISRFLDKLDNSTFPVRLSEVQITTRKEGTDDLAVSLGMSTICEVADASKPRRTTRPATIAEAAP